MTHLNFYYLLAIAVISCGSIPKGYDEGGFSASVTLKSFQADFNLKPSAWKDDPSGLANRKANISSFGVLGAAFGALLAVAVTDRFGRLRCWRGFVLTWAAGLFIQIFSSGIYGLILFARLFSGLGAGGLTVVAPLYLTEIAPARSRGMVVSAYMVVLLSFLMLGFFINYGASTGLPPTPMQYRLVQSIPLIPVGLAFIASFWLMDTPRWLASNDRSEEAITALKKLRGGEEYGLEAEQEFNTILQQCQVKEQLLNDTSLWSTVREITVTPTYRKRFLLGAFMQTVAQWSGGNGITYYIPQIFTWAGVTGSNTSLITSGAYGAVKLFFTMVFTWGLVEVIGRRRCMLTGLFLQCITHIYMAVYMSLFRDTENKPASDAAIASVFVYAVGWSIGLCTVQYLYSTEIYPTKIRGVCYATNMTLHWFFQFAVVRVTPNMFVSLDIYGAYIFWALICAIGFIVLGVWAPETRGIPMEQMEALFAGKWWMGWRARERLLAQERSGNASPTESLRERKQSQAEEVEKV